MRYLFVIFLLSTLSTFSQNPLDKLIRKDPWLYEIVSQYPYQVQIIYTQIDRDSNNKPAFESFKFGVDENEYFYPASTVKMPAAFLALEKLNRLQILDLDKDTPLKIGADRDPQVAVAVDSSAQDLQPSIANYIKKIFVVSDNDAYNRLYEFLGQQYFNETLHKKGYKNTRVVHRLGPEGFPFGIEDNQYTNAFTFIENDKMVYYQGEVHSKWDDNLSLLRNQQKGIAHVNRRDELVQEPFNFQVKNFLSLQDLHNILKAVIFPEKTASARRFDLSQEDYQFLYDWMSRLPDESDFPEYEQKEDNYVKFFWKGDQPGEIPDNIKIFNKVGWAYGFLTDVSYIIDTKNGLEYFLAATIHVNKNETYNDGVYEYETIGLPFFSKLGKAVYELELDRKRKYQPDFSKFQN